MPLVDIPSAPPGPRSGGFLEDDVGSGYADVGEEVDWTIEEGHDGEGRDESGERSSQPPKKLKGGDGKGEGSACRLASCIDRCFLVPRKR